MERPIAMGIILLCNGKVAEHGAIGVLLVHCELIRIFVVVHMEVNRLIRYTVKMLMVVAMMVMIIYFQEVVRVLPRMDRQKFKRSMYSWFWKNIGGHHPCHPAGVVF